jgi:hypothetical protein
MKRTQIGWVFIIIVIALIAFMLWNALHTGYPQAVQNKMYIGVGFTLLILLQFYKMTISVDDEYVRFSMGIGLIRKKYKLSDISSCKPISYMALGWGIRYRPGAILFNVSGNKAIELELKTKFRKVWLGTNAPEELSSFINEKIK